MTLNDSGVVLFVWSLQNNQAACVAGVAGSYVKSTLLERRWVAIMIQNSSSDASYWIGAKRMFEEDCLFHRSLRPPWVQLNGTG